MSQTENAVNSSSGTKRTCRKGNPVPARERQIAFLARRNNIHKAFHGVIQARLKDRLSELANEEGINPGADA
ncbi:transcriptional regulator [Salmonella enterica subsp. enterica serovar Newport]|nr:transcriptional regulator [Salmonella enterica]EIR7526273.1 transcriptional regulator [Salmonella enterica subsp. enterica serovar Brandenburg]EJP4069104.1 transcriptional regulator [Salmonella enterica subsp. enterica serovar Newport]HCM4029750.1 transcriptional regulator [Salmonella enterica subsp. enterica serovar Nima]EIR7596875.1 transcriptional regulator [Salmonella enterica subsp. enterica serovar Brandenburg]